MRFSAYTPVHAVAVAVTENGFDALVMHHRDLRGVVCVMKNVLDHNGVAI